MQGLDSQDLLVGRLRGRSTWTWDTDQLRHNCVSISWPSVPSTAIQPLPHPHPLTRPHVHCLTSTLSPRCTPRRYWHLGREHPSMVCQGTPCPSEGGARVPQPAAPTRCTGPHVPVARAQVGRDGTAPSRVEGADTRWGREFGCYRVSHVEALLAKARKATSPRRIQLKKTGTCTTTAHERPAVSLVSNKSNRLV